MLKKSKMHNSKVKLIEIHDSLFGFLLSAWLNINFTKEMTLLICRPFLVWDIFGLEILLLLESCYKCCISLSQL